MGKGSWQRPYNKRAFDENYERMQRERNASQVPIVTENVAREPRLIALTLDELRTVVFKTSVAYAHGREGGGDTIQEREWARAAALRDALEDLGFKREAEMIGGAG